MNKQTGLTYTVVYYSAVYENKLLKHCDSMRESQKHYEEPMKQDRKVHCLTSVYYNKVRDYGHSFTFI